MKIALTSLPFSLAQTLRTGLNVLCVGIMQSIFFFTVGQISYLPEQPVEVQIGAVCTYRQKTTQSYAYNMYN